jgi:hypothetical protein
MEAFSRPYGTGKLSPPIPSDKSLGYCRLSLRDKKPISQLPVAYTQASLCGAFGSGSFTMLNRLGLFDYATSAPDDGRPLCQQLWMPIV